MRMGRVKLIDDAYSEAVKKFEREYQEYVAELDRRYQWPEKSTRAQTLGVTRATFIQYGIIAALISVIIVSVLSLRVH
jgi:hypothetical protein